MNEKSSQSSLGKGNHFGRAPIQGIVVRGSTGCNCGGKKGMSGNQNPTKKLELSPELQKHESSKPNLSLEVNKILNKLIVNKVIEDKNSLTRKMTQNASFAELENVKKMGIQDHSASEFPQNNLSIIESFKKRIVSILSKNSKINKLL
ncbi:hypothetical protein [Bacillus massilinigeriensis]|uniref:hypothetical protein n=1 Tax=Bacillus massilionigeriensis TaxID=1805475 RepID=UPI00096B131B|nr:hypothetical protein [Bacillus massilionigeriensis]